MIRPLQDELDNHAFMKHVTITSSCDGQFVNVMGNIPTKILVTEELDEYVESIKHVKIKGGIDHSLKK